MNGLLSMFATEATWFTTSGLALTAVTVLFGWWLALVVLTVQAREETGGA